MGISASFDGYRIDMSNWDFDLTDLPKLQVTSFSSTTIKGHLGDYDLTIKGTGFAFGNTGISGGTVQSLTEDHGDGAIASVTGLNLSVKTVLDLVQNGNASQIAEFYKAQFSGDDQVSGSQFADVLVAYNGNDRLAGNAGNDRIYGGQGNDRIAGGIGADHLYGEAGKDTFVFTSVTESKASSYDTIFDFDYRAGERIDLSAIDADTKAAGNQAFEFIGSAEFSGDAGELRFVKEKSITSIYGDINGDKVPDLVIHVVDAMDMTGDYFLL